jgi:hypothetical protein
MPKKESGLKDSLVEQLQHLLSAENQLVDALPKMADAPNEPKLKEASDRKEAGLFLFDLAILEPHMSIGHTPQNQSVSKEKKLKTERLVEKRSPINAQPHRGRALASTATRFANVTDKRGHDIENPT